MRVRMGLIILVLAAALAGCAVRKVTPVAMTQPGDAQLGCAEIASQIAANRSHAAELVGTDNEVAQGNVARGIAMGVAFGGLGAAASLDLSNAEQVQARALLDRNERLTFLAREKGCPTP